MRIGAALRELCPKARFQTEFRSDMQSVCARAPEPFRSRLSQVCVEPPSVERAEDDEVPHTYTYMHMHTDAVPDQI